MQKITEKDFELFEEVAKFLSGRIRNKSKKEMQNRAKMEYLIRRFGYIRFQELLMAEIREIGEAGPSFMYRANLNIKSQMMELNRKYREKYVNPRLYNVVDTIPATNFAYSIGATISEDQTDKDFTLDLYQILNSEDEDEISKGKEEIEDSEDEISKGKEEIEDSEYEISKRKEEIEDSEDEI